MPIQFFNEKVQMHQIKAMYVNWLWPKMPNFVCCKSNMLNFVSVYKSVQTFLFLQNVKWPEGNETFLIFFSDFAILNRNCAQFFCGKIPYQFEFKSRLRYFSFNYVSDGKWKSANLNRIQRNKKKNWKWDKKK